MRRMNARLIRALAVAVAVAVAISACGVASSASPTVASSPIASSGVIASTPPTSPPSSPDLTPSEVPSQAPEPNDDFVAGVVTTDLVVRTKPGTGADSEILRPSLNEPQLLYVLEGPVPASGYDWYLVTPLFPDYLPHGEDPPSGWVAGAGKDGEPWIAAISDSPLNCPRQPDLYAIMYLSYLTSLACFGDRELTLEGTTKGCVVSDPVTVEPGWLSSVGCLIAQDGPDPQTVPYPAPLILRFADGGGVNADERVTVTGHFDDPAARTCRSTPSVGTIPPAPELVVLGCRTQFVVTDIEHR